MSKTILTILTIFLLYAPSMSGRSRILEDFTPVCDSLAKLMEERSTVEGKLKLKAVMKRGQTLDFYFTVSLSDMPWRPEDRKWFLGELEKMFPPQYRSYRIGNVYSERVKLENLVTRGAGCDGRPNTDSYRAEEPGRKTYPVVERKGVPKFPEGMEGRHIAVWQSHGLYFDRSQDRWQWQRPCLFQTVEDLFTQSYVLPYLVPMLENAGAYVMLPRERDLQTNEIIIDNDPDFRSCPGEDTDASGDLAPRTSGIYSESGNWKNAGEGFADAKAAYTGVDNPFRMGTARMVQCVPQNEKGKVSEIVWTPVIPERGEYAVYVSYKTLPGSTESAHYTVRHAGGMSEFIVNQKIGGGTWIYLGTFEFMKGDKGMVSLDNVTPEGRPYVKGSVVSADAVKIGGGFGNIARSSGKDMPEETSGMPRFTEAARYWLQWAGIDSTIFSQNGRCDDYKDDFMSRGDWVAYMSGGSPANPGKEGKGIPFDLAFALHSDAGTTPNDSTIGTLAIYTLISEGVRKLPSGEDRHTSREFADIVQSQIVSDIRAGFEPEWNRRFIWNRGYRESRTPTSPSMLCELLSHQNFADMKHGLDPSFRFTVSRAIYKGMLKYLGNRYGKRYKVQPLPVNSFAARLDGSTVRLSWKETADTLEPTADAESFMLQTRIDGGAFSKGTVLKNVRRDGDRYSTEIKIEEAHIYSFRLIACNKGGMSFPSETLSAGIPSGKQLRHERVNPSDSCVMIVNNFSRVSPPAWFDYPEYAGFDNRIDGGVPYIKEIAFTGEMYDFRRNDEWKSNENPGFGASHNDFAGHVIAGNTFDYPYIHGKAVMRSGYPFCSSSSEAFSADSTLRKGFWCTDIICGKQVRTTTGNGNRPYRFEVFPEKMRSAILDITSRGCNIIISGANIGTDVWGGIYPVEVDSLSRAEAVSFVKSTFGYRWVTGNASRNALVKPVNIPEGTRFKNIRSPFGFNNRPDGKLYCVEAPDGIAPARKGARTFLRYDDTRISAAVLNDAGNYRTVSFGFPIEIITDENTINEIFKSSFNFFKQ